MDANLPPPWMHQAKEVAASQTVPERGLLWDVGTGKSRATIDILRYRYAAHGRVLRTIIFAPKIVLTNWKREIQKYSRIHPWDVHILIGTGKKRLALFNEKATQDGVLAKPQVFITNYESLEMEPLRQAFNTWGPEVVVADEAHRLKNPESKRAKYTIELGDKALYRYVLTGTPIGRNALDIFNIFRFLDRGDTFGKNFWRFRSDWFEDVNSQWQGKPNYFPKYEPRPQTYQEFNNRIFRKCSRAIKSECLDLPPFVRKEVHVELSKEQAKLYADMKKEYIAYIDDILKTDTPRAVVAQMAITKSLRLQQIVTGYAKTEQGEIYKIKENPRIEALEELLETLTPDHKVIVWSVFHENYADIIKVCEKLGVAFAQLHGQITNQKLRDKDIDRFENDPSCRVLIGNQAAGGIGINLVASDVSIYYSKNHNFIDDVQSEGRNYRGGSEKHTSVTRIDIIATDTIDELISQALAFKQDISNKILDWRDKL